MKRFSFVLLVCCVVSAFVSVANGQTTVVKSTADLGKHLNIGANPVFPAGYPADSLTAHPGWEIRAFDFPISIRTADRDGKICEGYVDKFEPLIVSVLTDGPTETVYCIHVVQKCGNPVYGRWVSIAKSPPPVPEPPKVIQQPPKATREAQPIYSPEPVVITEKGGHGRDFAWDAWLGVATSRSLESKAVDSFEGLYIDVPFTTKWTWKLAGATSQSNFEKYRGGVTHIRPYAGNLSRLQTGVAWRPTKSVSLQGLLGVQYDHRVKNWQPGPLLEGYVGFNLGPFWNEENATYQGGTQALWYRTRHRAPIIIHGSTVWSVGGEYMRSSFRDNPTGQFYHYYTTRGHGFLHLESTWFTGRTFTALVGIGRGSKSEKWGVILEAGTRLW